MKLPKILGRRIYCVKNDKARVEVYYGHSLQDGEWKPVTDFIQTKTAQKLVRRMSNGNS